MANLEGPRLEPAPGARPKHLIIILHGFAANGHAVVWLAHAWRIVLPDAAFVAPYAPEMTLLGARQWFPLSVRSSIERWKGVNHGAPALRAYIAAELARYRLPESACVLAGFSQGAEMALHVGLRWPRPFAGIIGYSGLLAGEGYIQSEIKSRPPVLLIHGDRDNVIPVQALHNARHMLTRCGVQVEWHVAHGLGHKIDTQGVAIGARFLQSVLPKGDGLL